MSGFAGYARGSKDEAPLTDFDWMVRSQVFGSFGRSGRTLTTGDLAAVTGSSPSRVRGSLIKLQDARELVMDEGGDKVLMAHPFSGVPTSFPVETSEFTCYANCVWDALSIPALLRCDGWTKTSCPSSGETLEFGVKRWNVEGDDGVVVHLLTPLRRAWDDIGFT